MFPNFLALGWVALAAGAAQRALDGGGWRSLTLLAAAGAGLILTHTPTAYLAALLAAAFLLVHCRPRRVAGALAAGLAALTVTAWFWVPMLQTAREAQTDYLTEAHPYRQSLWMHQDQGAGMFEQDWAFLNGAGAVIGVAQALLAASLLRRRGAAGLLGGLPIVAGMTVAASLWPTGEWLTALPMYDSVQFCWRWQPLLALWCAFAFAAARHRSLILPGAVLACILGLFAPLTFPLKEHGGKAADLASNLIEMRPVGAPRERYPPGSPGIAEVVQGKCGITPERLEPALRVYRVRAKTACTIRIRTFHFSDWTATLDGLPTPIERERKTALHLVRAPRGGGLLELRYRRPTLLGKLTID
jgi:hypothetical protein